MINKNKLKDLLYHVSNILNNDSFDIQSFKIKKSKMYVTISCIVYTNPDSLDEMDETTGVKLKFKHYKHGNSFPSILSFGKYKVAIEEYEAKRLYQNLLNRKYSNLINNTTDKYADKLIEDAIRIESDYKKSGMNKISNVIEAIPAGDMEIGFDEPMDDVQEMPMPTANMNMGEVSYDEEAPQMSNG